MSEDAERFVAALPDLIPSHRVPPNGKAVDPRMIYGANPQTLAHRLGLRDGDRLVHVNGQTLPRDLGEVDQLRRRIRSSGKLVLGIDRGGQAIELTIPLAPAETRRRK